MGHSLCYCILHVSGILIFRTIDKPISPVEMRGPDFNKMAEDFVKAIIDEFGDPMIPDNEA